MPTMPYTADAVPNFARFVANNEQFGNICVRWCDTS